MIILPIHIGIALASVGFSTFLYFSPTRNKFYVTYGLVALTLITGTILVIASRAQILSACTSGLVYIGFMLMAIYASHRKLAVQKSRQSVDE